MNKRGEVGTAFERALEQIQARVSVSADGKPISLAVAYSGGLDSSVLLHLAADYAQSKAISVHAFHVHHGLSQNADNWLEHCRREAAHLGLPFDAVRLALDAQSIGIHGTEQAARIARYRALSDLCVKHGVCVLLAAHHQDDQAETLVLQLLRGAGPAGLAGMALLQVDHVLLGSAAALGRPLLEVSRAELEAYANLQGLRCVTDESNRDLSYRRNVLRQSVFPLLQEHFPGFSACIARSASHMQATQALLEEMAASDLEKCRSGHDETALSIEQLHGLSPERCDNVLRHWLRGFGMPAPNAAHLQQLRSQMLDARHDRQPLVEMEKFALSRAGTCLVLRAKLGKPPVDDIILHWQGEPSVAVPEWRGTLVFDRTKANGIAEHRLHAAPLILRPRRGQEKLKMSENRPSRILKNLFQEKAIPVWQREWLPLAYLEQELVFAAGLGMHVRACSAGAGIVLTWVPDWQNTR